MYKAEFEVEAITPIFMRGADQRKAEIRASSIKGLMRWWFRALAGSYFGDDVVGLKKVEDYVFGSTGCRSKIIVDINVNNINKLYKPLPMVWNKKSRKRQLSEAIVDANFNVCVKSHNVDLIELAFYSLYMLFTLGSIGFRHTRGAGSVKISAINFEEFEPNVETPFNFTDKNYFCQKINVAIDEILRETNEILDDLVKKLNFEPNLIFDGCHEYSALTPNCSGVYVWCGENSRESYYESDDLTNPKSLLDRFEYEFKKYSEIKYGYKNYIFGLPRTIRKNRRMSPMHVGVVNTEKENFLKILIFKTKQYHPKVRANWSNLDKFIKHIKAKKIWPGVID